MKKEKKGVLHWATIFLAGILLGLTVYLSIPNEPYPTDQDSLEQRNEFGNTF